jgi:4-hydroxybenzoate polyprenyltransferase
VRNQTLPGAAGWETTTFSGLFGVSGVLAGAFSFAAGLTAAGIMVPSAAIGILYSLPPARLSYRTFLAPLTLAVAYVGILYWVGVAGDSLLLAALYLLTFVAFLRRPEQASIGYKG